MVWSLTVQGEHAYRWNCLTLALMMARAGRGACQHAASGSICQLLRSYDRLRMLLSPDAEDSGKFVAFCLVALAKSAYPQGIGEIF